MCQLVRPSPDIGERKLGKGFVSFERSWQSIGRRLNFLESTAIPLKKEVDDYNDTSNPFSNAS